MIKENVKKLLDELPVEIEVVAAVKTRTVEEIVEAINTGIRIIGHNYVQEAEAIFKEIGHMAQYHFIGHLQTNKVKKAVEFFDMIETVDSVKIAAEINRRCAQIRKIMPVLIEVNSAKEPQKHGVMPEDVENLAKWMTSLNHIKVMGLMTMGPFTGNPEEARPYFIKTRECFEKIKSSNISNIEMKYLSMGMTNSYKIAIEEKANMVRIGTKLFGERP
jgi:pyridoxal phosphate enzyme (YggS family)